ncbi:MAG TPA: hypothetical protein VFV50_10055 [Bdellovibrionales bacterium]|nr:hypothetical protein [Bdellovibrionales bacterium]
MIRLVIAAVVLLSGGPAAADLYVGAGTGIRVQKYAAGAGSVNTPVHSFVLGALWERWMFLGEVSQARYESGAGSVYVHRSETGALAWVRHAVTPSYWFSYVALGGGIRSSMVETGVAGATAENRGESEGVGAVALGLQSQVANSFNLGFELRSLSELEAGTEPWFETMARLFYQF